MIYKLEKDKDVLSDSSGEECQGNSKDCQPSRKIVPVFEQDLNCLPYEADIYESPENKLDDQTLPGSVSITLNNLLDTNYLALNDLAQFIDSQSVNSLVGI